MSTSCETIYGWLQYTLTTSLPGRGIAEARPLSRNVAEVMRFGWKLGVLAAWLLVIDADMHRPQLATQVPGTNPPYGLAALLLGLARLHYLNTHARTSQTATAEPAGVWQRRAVFFLKYLFLEIVGLIFGIIERHATPCCLFAL